MIELKNFVSKSKNTFKYLSKHVYNDDRYLSLRLWGFLMCMIWGRLNLPTSRRFALEPDTLRSWHVGFVLFAWCGVVGWRGRFAFVQHCVEV